jgi:nucleoside-diphosphate-sugar epimerase
MAIHGDLDDRTSLFRLAGLADAILHLAPPNSISQNDRRTRNLLAALSHGNLPQRLVYVSTSGVYGDCGGAVVSETHPLHPQNARAQRRADAEKQIRAWAQRNCVHVCILRVPGIYAANRLPLERIQQGTPVIVASEDSYTNHIHADELAHILMAALHFAKPNRIYHTSDDSELKMGDYFDKVADALALPRSPRVSRAEAQQVLSPMLLTFMNESRRLTNLRMKQELKVVLHFPTVADALKCL